MGPGKVQFGFSFWDQFQPVLSQKDWRSNDFRHTLFLSVSPLATWLPWSHTVWFCSVAVSEKILLHMRLEHSYWNDSVCVFLQSFLVVQDAATSQPSLLCVSAGGEDGAVLDYNMKSTDKGMDQSHSDNQREWMNWLFTKIGGVKYELLKSLAANFCLFSASLATRWPQLYECEWAIKDRLQRDGCIWFLEICRNSAVCSS